MRKKRISREKVVYSQREMLKLKDMKKILFIIGSLRKKSFNRQVARVAKEIIGGNAEVQELDYSDLSLLSQDIEQPELEVVADKLIG